MLTETPPSSVVSNAHYVFPVPSLSVSSPVSVKGGENAWEHDSDLNYIGCNRALSLSVARGLDWNRAYKIMWFAHAPPICISGNYISLYTLLTLKQASLLAVVTTFDTLVGFVVGALLEAITFDILVAFIVGAVLCGYYSPFFPHNAQVQCVHTYTLLLIIGGDNSYITRHSVSVLFSWI